MSTCVAAAYDFMVRHFRWDAPAAMHAAQEACCLSLAAFSWPGVRWHLTARYEDSQGRPLPLLGCLSFVASFSTGRHETAQIPRQLPFLMCAVGIRFASYAALIRLRTKDPRRAAGPRSSSPPALECCFSSAPQKAALRCTSQPAD